MKNTSNEWKYSGEVTSRERSKNSLLKDNTIEFEKIQDITKESFNYVKYIKTRLFEKKFDNFVTPTKKVEEIKEVVEYEEKIDMTKKEMEELFKEIVDEINEESNINDLYCNMTIESKMGDVKSEEIKKNKNYNREKESMRVLKRYKNVKIIKHNDK
ncbi:hypothetical protein H311_02294 [Anncaliia algerae PRA109]|nr:hypothetical protein H311_02294 [Anncaliia algerae PRA109]